MTQDTNTVRVRYATNRRPLLIPPVAARPKGPRHAVAVHEMAQRDSTTTASAEPARPFVCTIIVERTSRNSAEYGTCALCWTGPGPLAGIVRRDTTSAEASAICSRCLVTLEMLAVQFDCQLQLHVETAA